MEEAMKIAEYYIRRKRGVRIIKSKGKFEVRAIASQQK